jgi:hypothetical protein
MPEWGETLPQKKKKKKIAGEASFAGAKLGYLVGF